MIKICPLRMLAQESDWDTINNCGTANDVIQYTANAEALACLGKHCAWWNYDFDCCSVTALTTVATRPFAQMEDAQ